MEITNWLEKEHAEKLIDSCDECLYTCPNPHKTICIDFYAAVK